MNFLPFAAARAYAHTTGVTSSKAWRQLMPEGKLPADIPAAPEIVYKRQGWVGWPDFLLGIPSPPGYSRAKLKTQAATASASD